MLKEKDLKILKELKKDSRQSTADLGRKLGIPRVTVHERIRKLKDEGIIRRFTVEPGYQLMGLAVKAFILVSFSPGPKSQRDLANELAKFEEIQEVEILAGDWDILLKARAESLESLGSLVVDKIRKVSGVEKTVTIPVLATAKDEV